jgi:hypothetical protein
MAVVTEMQVLVADNSYFPQVVMTYSSMEQSSKGNVPPFDLPKWTLKSGTCMDYSGGDDLVHEALVLLVPEWPQVINESKDASAHSVEQ